MLGIDCHTFPTLITMIIINPEPFTDEDDVFDDFDVDERGKLQFVYQSSQESNVSNTSDNIELQLHHL